MFARVYPALAISLAVHAALLAVLGAIKLAVDEEPDSVLVETVFNEERVQEQFSQDVELDTTVSQALSLTAGGVISEHIGAAAAAPIAQARVIETQALSDPTIRMPTIGEIDVPGLGDLQTDLGEGQVSGEVGARVDGYGAAMHRLTQEILRMMRQSPVVAVWLFDASNSLKDDRAEIRDNFHKIYDELDIARRQADQRNERYSPLETVIGGFGQKWNPITPRPTDDLAEIKAAIDRVQEDETGEENVFSPISAVIDQYGATTGRSRRKLAVIVVTDESGDDEQFLEDAVKKAKQFSAPVYILGREAIFGYKTARVLWIDPETKLPHWPTINRGPETAFPECLQYEGFHDRSWEAASSGFGPYAQVRLAKESGGIYFLLSRDEENLVGWGARTQRKFDDIAMKEYEPLVVERREYERLRDTSPFRKTVWEVINALDPGRDPQLNLQRDGYPIDNEGFRRVGQMQFDKTLRAMRILNEAVERLDRVRPERDAEASQRWRAAYDLIYAQCLSYRVRQFQLLLALDQHVLANPKPNDPKSNQWDVRHITNMLAPTEQQIKETKVDTAELEAQRQKAMDMFQFVIERHPDTPWALRARQEMGWGFGISFVEDFWDPRYSDPKYQGRVPKF